MSEDYQAPSGAGRPITPPPELFRQWEGMPRSLAFEAAYRAGADDELEACCEWLKAKEWIHSICPEFRDELRADRRPNLKEQALAQLAAMERLWEAAGNEPSDIVRRALETLPND